VCRRDTNFLQRGLCRHGEDTDEHQLGGVALFFQGCTGISNPKVRDAEQIGTELARDVISLCEGPMAESTGSVEGRLASVDLPFQPMPLRISGSGRALQAVSTIVGKDHDRARR